MDQHQCVGVEKLDAHIQRVGDHVERREHAAPLGWGLTIDDRGVRGAANTRVELVFMTQPRGQLLRARSECQQVREQAPYAYKGSVPLIDEWIFERLASARETVNAAQNVAAKFQI